MTGAFTADQIRHLFNALNDQLAREDIAGEVYLVGGAVMCLVFQVRPSTKDVDAYFLPAAQLRKAAVAVAAHENVPENWLNDAVKVYLSDRGAFGPYLALSHLTIFAAQPDYLLAMKCLATRIGEGFHDLDDIRYLLRYLNVEHSEEARAILSRYYPLEKFPQRTLYALEELLEK